MTSPGPASHTRGSLEGHKGVYRRGLCRLQGLSFQDDEADEHLNKEYTEQFNFGGGLFERKANSADPDADQDTRRSKKEVQRLLLLTTLWQGRRLVCGCMICPVLNCSPPVQMGVLFCLECTAAICTSLLFLRYHDEHMAAFACLFNTTCCPVLWHSWCHAGHASSGRVF